MAKKRKNQKNLIIPKALILVCIITGIGTLVLRILNRRMLVSELHEITGYAGTAFAISLIIILGIWLVNFIKNK